MKALARGWNAFWFAPAAPVNLAAARIIIALHALWILGSRDFAGISALPEVFWQGVPPSARWRYLLFPGHSEFEAGLTLLAALTLIAVALGLATRVTCLTSALLLYHLAPLETIIWTSSPYERGLEISVIALVVLAVSPCADALRVGRQRRPSTRATSPDYNWPLLVIQLVIAQVYLFAGYAKLYRVGPDWVDAENLRRWLLAFNQQDQVAVFRWLAPLLAASDVTALLVAIAALTFDLVFIVTLFWRRSRVVLLPMAVAFHAVILFAFNIAFLNFPQLLVFVDWEWWGLRRRMHASAVAASEATFASR